MYSPSVSAAGTSGPSLSTPPFVRASLLVLFTYVFLANAWIGDDAHITFRTVWNVIHGYGLTYNPDERVQAYTDPLWMMAVAAAHFVTREFLFTVTALSWAFDVAAGVVLVRRTRTLGGAALMVGWLVSSKALVDYSSSGLEYPLSYFLLAVFYTRYLDRPADAPDSNRDLRFFVFVAALGFVTRVDMALLFLVPVVEMALRSFWTRGRTEVAPVLVGALPAVLWLTFATLYYGFPLPNTYYAKVANGIPTWLLHEQGWAYLFNSVSHDPITLGTVAMALLFAWRAPGPARRAALSALLYIVYTVAVGGDFMSGRFFAMPFLVAAIVLVPEIERSLLPWVAAGLVLYNIIVPLVPIKTTATYDGAWPWRSQNGIKDERGHTHQGSNLLTFAPFRTIPDSPFAREGLSFGASEVHSTVYCCIGQFGLNAGPTKHIIDENALSDPLLARLPVSPRVYFDFWASHYFRDMPEGYVESTERDQNLLTEPMLHQYYDLLRNVTRGPVFRASRFRDIWSLNVGYRHLHDEYDKRRSISLSIPASHFRFQTDVGVRDEPPGTIRTTGRAGYLQYGPGIPLSPRFYRARWIGTVDAAPGGRVGFVEVWSDGVRLDRQAVVRAEAATGRTIARIDFTLQEAARAVEYRLYVNRDVRVTVERVELFSGLAIPADAP